MSTDTLEITDLETLWDHDLNCEAEHLGHRHSGRVTPMPTPCSVQARWLYTTCDQRKVVCDSFYRDTCSRRVRHTLCDSDCRKFVEL